MGVGEVVCRHLAESKRGNHGIWELRVVFGRGTVFGMDRHMVQGKLMCVFREERYFRNSWGRGGLSVHSSMWTEGTRSDPAGVGCSVNQQEQLQL